MLTASSTRAALARKAKLFRGFAGPSRLSILEALRDGVIQADAATYDSLWDEAERLAWEFRRAALAAGE